MSWEDAPVTSMAFGTLPLRVTHPRVQFGPGIVVDRSMARRVCVIPRASATFARYHRNADLAVPTRTLGPLVVIGALGVVEVASTGWNEFLQTVRFRTLRYPP